MQNLLRITWHHVYSFVYLSTATFRYFSSFFRTYVHSWHSTKIYKSTYYPVISIHEGWCWTEIEVMGCMREMGERVGMSGVLQKVVKANVGLFGCFHHPWWQLQHCQELQWLIQGCQKMLERQKRRRIWDLCQYLQCLAQTHKHQGGQRSLSNHLTLTSTSPTQLMWSQKAPVPLTVPSWSSVKAVASKNFALQWKGSLSTKSAWANA